MANEKTGPWAAIDAMAQKHKADLKEVIATAKLLHFVRVKVADTGVWSVRRAAGWDGGADEIHERSAKDLLFAMEAESKQHTRLRLTKAEREERKKARLEALREKRAAADRLWKARLDWREGRRVSA